MSTISTATSLSWEINEDDLHDIDDRDAYFNEVADNASISHVHYKKQMLNAVDKKKGGSLTKSEKALLSEKESKCLEDDEKDIDEVTEKESLPQDRQPEGKADEERLCVFLEACLSTKEKSGVESEVASSTSAAGGQSQSSGFSRQEDKAGPSSNLSKNMQNFKPKKRFDNSVKPGSNVDTTAGSSFNPDYSTRHAGRAYQGGQSHRQRKPPSTVFIPSGSRL